MVAKSFEVGDLVWAKMKGYPPWPGKIIEPPGEAKVKKAHHYVYFYGSENHAWIPDENILLHNDRLVQEYATKKRPAIYLSAVETIVNASKSSDKYQDEQQHDSSFEKLRDSTLPPPSSARKEGGRKRTPKRKALPQPPLSRDSPIENSEGEVPSFALSPKAPKFDDDCLDEEYSTLMSNVPPNIDYPCDVQQQRRCTPTPPGGILSFEYIEPVELPPFDLHAKNEVLINKEVKPTDLRIGFVGLGRVGLGLARNLVLSHHKVTIWNRTSEKCKQLLDMGAEAAATPCDLVSVSDIVFCCVVDADAAKSLVFGNCGILKGLESCSDGEKGYVEMTSMDYRTSQAIGEQVKLKGGTYLEAPLSGSRQQAMEGTLNVVCAGDEKLYKKCRSCFDAMTRHVEYLGSTVGTASKFSVVHNMLMGTVYAALAESLALVKRVGLNQKDFLNILGYGALNCQAVNDKGTAMAERKYVANMPLRHVQKDLSQALVLGSLKEQPMPIAAAANEVYKNCKRMRYADHDVSAVYEATRL